MLKALIKLRILEMLSTRKSKNGNSLGTAGMIILLFFVGVSFLFLFGTIAFALVLGLSITGYKWLYFAIMAIMVFMLSFIGTVFSTKQQMFEAKDNQALLSMPIKPKDILISRLLAVGLMDYLLAFLVALPFGVVYAIFGGFSFIGGLFYVLGILLLPLLALSCSILFGWILAALSRRMKHKNIVTLLFSTVFLLAYFYLCFSWQDRIEVLIEHGEEVSSSIARYLPPAYHFGNALANGSAISFLIFALICIIPFVLAIVLVSRNFVKIITTESGAPRIEYKAGSMRASSELVALSRMELNRFTSSAAYMLNAGMGLMFIPLASAFLLIKKADVMDVIGHFDNLSIYVAPVMILAMLYLSSMTIISASTISLDAKTLWIPKALPIKESNVLLSKAFPHFVVSVPFVLIASIVLQFPFKIGFIGRIMLIFVPIIASAFNALLGVVINLHFPKFNWTNEAQVVKQGASAFLAMLISAVPVILLTIITVIIGVTKVIPMGFALGLYLIIYVIGCFLLYKWMISKGANRFKAL